MLITRNAKMATPTMLERRTPVRLNAESMPGQKASRPANTAPANPINATAKVFSASVKVSDAAVAAVVNAQLDSLPYLTTTTGPADAHAPTDQTNTQISRAV